MSQKNEGMMAETEWRVGLARVAFWGGAALAPLPILLLGWGYGATVAAEEMAKWLLLLWASQQAGERELGWGFVVGAGLMFGLGEGALYATNSFLQNDWSQWMMRLVTTVPMHAATMSAMYVIGQQGKWRWGAALAVGVGLHLGFNWLVGSV